MNNEMMSSGEIPVPSALLAVDGTPPGEGDDVEFTVKGTVGKTENGLSYVRPTEVNGQPVPEAKDAEPDEDDVRNAAEKADSDEDDSSGAGQGY